MKRYTMSMAAAIEHTPEHPERTAYHCGKGMDFDYHFRVWPSRGAMLESIRMEQRREPRPDDWRDWTQSRMAITQAKRNG